MKKESANFPVVRCEMQHLPFRNEVFSTVVNMFTSFGYLPSEKEDKNSLREIARTLKQEGKFLIDIVNRDHLLKVFQISDLADFGTFTMEEKRSLDEDKMKVTSQWVVTRKDNRERLILTHVLRLYTLENLGQMLVCQELIPKAVYGNYKAEEFTPDSSRLIILAQKPPVDLAK
jgi:SAM-dependent methyltransferase